MKAPTEILGSRVIKGSRSYDFFRWPISHLACAMVLAVLAAILAGIRQSASCRVCLSGRGRSLGGLLDEQGGHRFALSSDSTKVWRKTVRIVLQEKG